MTIFSKGYLLASLAVACLVLTNVEANASVVTYSFEGNWFGYQSFGSFFPAQNPGDPFTGTLTYDDSTPDAYSGTVAGFAEYTPTGIITVTFGGSTLENTFPSTDQHIDSYGSPYSPYPVWELVSFNCNQASCGAASGDAGGTFDGSPLYFLSSSIRMQGDDSDIPYSGISPLPLWSSLPPINRPGLRISARPGSSFEVSLSASGNLTSLRQVPEPAALPRMTTALVGLGYIACRRKQQAVAQPGSRRYSHPQG